LAGEDTRYVAWIRTQPCAACGTTLQIEPHHALSGTTYSPEGPRPAKAIPGARKGKSQRSHDHFCIPLCIKDHEPGFHQGHGYFEGWSPRERDDWEMAQVGIHRNRYAMQCPDPAALPARATTRRAKPTSSPERERVLEQIETWAGARRLKAEEHQLLADLINDLKAEGF
jgi:hypothetical protein